MPRGDRSAGWRPKAAPSLDDAARGLFAGASRRVRALRTIVWVNPGSEGGRALAWLEAGAPAEVVYRLRAGEPRP
ncbi:hypothetical protein ACSRUE_04360 [Sorangium sp. KYC3313]|uniref:hypothetical protein n=1 Tax=Sorangium sp. KYC3313 TaxID=3449740 RepID=UPI003F89FA5D